MQNKIEYITIDHVQLAMPAGREDDARAFYHSILGLSEVTKPATLEGRGGVWFEAGPVRVHLGVESDFRPARKAHPAIEVKSLEALVEQVQANGCKVSAALGIPGRDRVYVDDPFGNRLEFLETRLNHSNRQ